MEQPMDVVDSPASQVELLLLFCSLSILLMFELCFIFFLFFSLLLVLKGAKFEGNWK
jgi:hypothetical protein